MATNALTLSIVGVVVLVNSVAWGIPLLTGTEGAGPLHRAARPDPITTGAIPRPARRPDIPAGNGVPLPVRLPVSAPDATDQRASEPSDARATSPKTLYPINEPAPVKLLVPPAKPSTKPAEQRDVRTAAAPSYGWRDTAMVSPYAPGVRIKPEDKASTPVVRGKPLATDTTLDRARAIARRAAQRFEAMRARLDAPEKMRQAGLARQTLPLSAGRPTASLIGSSSASKSAMAYVRPRIVRRPIEPEQREQGQRRPVVVAAAPSLATLKSAQENGIVQEKRVDAGDTQTSGVTAKSAATVPVPALHHRPVRTTRLAARNDTRAPNANRPITRETAPATRKSRASRASAPAALRPTKRAAIKRTKRLDRRIASKRRQRRIEGFRPSFHRQLVSAGFFSAQR